ncbi:MAG: hypothetical protein HOV83_00390 [Catenulispora sp.]|nr:hypothetical protein [Catenulispora sp.]
MGVAGGAASFGAGSGGAAGTTVPASRSSVPAGLANPTSPAGAMGSVTPTPTASSVPPPETCSASVTGAVPKPEVSTDEQNRRWDTFSGVVAGKPWSIQLHVFPDAASYEKFVNKVPGNVPPQAITALHAGADVVFQTPGETGWGMLGKPEHDDDAREFVSLSSSGLDKDAAFLLHGWVSTSVDHMCLQYADHAEFVPVLHAQGGTFAIFGVAKQNAVQALIGYDANGREIGRQRARYLPIGALAFEPSG